MTNGELHQAFVKSKSMKIRPTVAIRSRCAGIKCKCGAEEISAGPTELRAKYEAALKALFAGWAIADNGKAVCCDCRTNL